jgi:hypothetical protein
VVWIPDGTGVFEDDGQPGGDRQATKAFSIRYINDGFPGGDPPGRVATVYFYGVDTGAQIGEPTGTYRVECQIEKTVCRDPQHPGDTEEWADVEHEDVPGPVHTSWQAAEKRARELAYQHNTMWLKWDGRAPWEGR